MGTAELFLILCGRTKEVLMGILSRDSELKRLRIKISQRMKTGHRFHILVRLVMGREITSQVKYFL